VNLCYYDLRHTCASLLIAQGASVKAVQAQMGHATASITLDTYGHLFPDELETLAERLERLRAVALGMVDRVGPEMGTAGKASTGSDPTQGVEAFSSRRPGLMCTGCVPGPAVAERNRSSAGTRERCRRRGSNP